MSLETDWMIAQPDWITFPQTLDSFGFLLGTSKPLLVSEKYSQFLKNLLTLPQGIYCLQETKSTHSDVLKLSHVHLYLSGIPSLEFQNCNPILNTRPHPLALFTIYAPSTVQDQRLDFQRKHQFWEHLRNIFNHYKSDFIPVLMGDFNTRLYHSTTIKYQDWNPTSAQPFSPPPLMTTYSPPLICHS